MKPVSRWIVLACALCMTGSLIFPFWKITLMAPQYPEGLEMFIYPNGVRGQIDLINGLNHYIGMKFIVNEDFPEFKLLPYWLGILVLIGIVTFIANKFKWLRMWVSLLLLTGIIGIVDFWRWEYNYGHHLDPRAAIKIPGMSYQPPLLGYKQLLNFTAGSFPAIGGYMIIIPGILLIGVAMLELRNQKKLSYVPVS
jgi:copper chaperone NosL